MFLQCSACIRRALVDLVFFWSVNKLARAITKWTGACDKRSARFISNIHHTREYRQYCYVGTEHSNADWGCFKAPILWEILRIQNPLLEEHYVFSEAEHSCQQVGCARKQTSVSHSSTEVEIISLDAGLRMDGFQALDLRDLVKEVFHSPPNQTNNTKDISTMLNLFL